MEPVPGSESSQEFVRGQLDEILAREITSFIDVDSDAAMISFNLATISCITIIVEREREIKQYADFPPERYNKESFTSELVDIGLDKDDYLEAAISSSLSTGYIRSGDDGELKAEMPAFMMAGFLDSMFPGMQGMNLIAFVLQMNHEVNSGRKTLELAKQSFETTLKTRGVAVTKDHAEKRASEMAEGVQQAVSVQSREVSTQLKKENLDRLSKLIKTRKKRGEYREKFKVQDVFDKGPTKEELEAEKKEIQQAEETARKAADLARQLAEKDGKIKEAEESARELAQQLKDLEEKEKALASAREEARIAKEKAAALEAREAEMAEKEARLRVLEEQIRQKEEQTRMQDEEQKTAQKEQLPGDDDDIESRIAAFEQELAMPCPLCAQGKVEEKTTEKGKSFFSCNQRDCRFVSWDKPYHFECPLCKNPFLTQMDVQGEKGLKCPRASCSYTQNNLLEPKQHMAAAAEAAKPKKKKKIVRRRKRR